MSEWDVSFTFHSWWRVGSGAGRMGVLDELVARSPDGLPWIAGKTLKGLVREALYELADFGQIKDDIPELICGSAPQDKLDDENEDNFTANRKRFSTKKGHVRFGSAEMPKEWRDWASSKKNENSPIIDALFDKRNMGAIENGVAKDNSLRSVEVTAPMVLEAKIQIISQEDITQDRADEISEALVNCAPLIRRIGRGRTRGFGRVSVKIEKSGGAND